MSKTIEQVVNEFEKKTKNVNEIIESLKIIEQNKVQLSKFGFSMTYKNEIIF